MSATATVPQAIAYKDQLKLMRASTATSWMFATFSWLLGAFRNDPTTASVDAPASTRYYGAFY